MERLEIFLPGSRPARALASAVRTLSGMGLKPGDYWLGGGAVLAARWGHRQEDSVNLCIEWRRQRALFRMDVEGRVREALPASQADCAERGLWWVRWETGHGRVGLFTRNPWWIKPWLSEQVEARHGIPLENNASILFAKIVGRLNNTGEILDRDLHDLAACAIRDPESLRTINRGWKSSYDPAIAKEILFLDRITPKEPDGSGEARSSLRQAASIYFSKDVDAFIQKVREGENSWLPEISSVPRRYPSEGVRGLSLLAPPEAFEHPCLREEAPFRQKDGFMGPMGKNMAGHPLNPSPEDIRDWLKNPKEAPRSGLSYMHEHFDKMWGYQAMELRQSCGASIRDIARATRTPRLFPPNSEFAGWLSRYAWRCAGDLREDIEGYGTLGGCRSFA